ncbi:DEAD/DEAH box helicase, partial [Rhizobium ruizarguesonis]
LGDESPDDISYATALRLLRSPPEGLAVESSPDLIHSGKIAAEELPGQIAIPGLHADLFPYQARGIQWMWETVNRTGGLILADEMGLGKTLQIIALLLLDPPEKTAPALVVCPTSLIANWVREFGKFAPDFSLMVHRGAHRAGIYRDLQVTSVVITTYEKMVNDISIFSSFEWSWVICDEAQAIKNPHSNRRQAVVTIPRRRSIPMTGTPVENTLMDLWSLADFAIPGMLGERSVFEVEFPDTVEAGQILGRLTDPIILKRRVRDVAADLPDRIDIDLPL